MKKLTNSDSTVFQFGLLLLALFALLFLLLAIAWPLFFIWALNTLFVLSIPYTFWTWLACWILILTFQGAINIKNDKILKINRKQVDK